ncbi:MAG: Gfo/Idh/MocA family oxidoreductase [Ginsengibacter sp.]
MKKINWGIIGCGDVTELKSGPSFGKVKNSSLVAVMRRDAEKAKDYAQRHHVPKWYNDAAALINDPEINAVYIATPPSSHEEYALAAIDAGKPVYVEKPMALNFTSAIKMKNAAAEKNIKLVIAHYRREQPYFKKIKQLLDEKSIGEVRFARLDFYRKLLSVEDLALPKNSWRVDTSVAGGGLFHDLAPHQLDLMLYFFGVPERVSGFSANQSRQYNADDIVSGNLIFKSDVLFSGLWCFNADSQNERDCCEICGSEGKLSFSVFGQQKLSVTKNRENEIIFFKPLKHVQQPMIEKVVEYFLDEAPNPCNAGDGAEVMRIMDKFTGI